MAVDVDGRQLMCGIGRACTKAALIGLITFAGTLAFANEPRDVEELETKNYLVRIEIHCEEGAVGCDDVRYVGKDKRTGKTMTLTGSTVHSTCSDGVTICQLKGYRFRNGAYTYFVSAWGVLIVERGGKSLLREEGELRVLK